MAKYNSKYTTGKSVDNALDKGSSAFSSLINEDAFAITDESGNSICAVVDGNIKTKKFDSSKSWIYGKNVAIIGDSISTNGDYGTSTNGNVPEVVICSEDVGKSLSAYITYYDVQAGLSINGHTYTSEEIGTKVSFTPTSSDIGKIVGKPYTYNQDSMKTWWEYAQEKLGFNPIPVCWSGSSISSHEASKDAYKCAHSWHESQINKCGIRVAGTTNRIAPDMIVVCRGTNDFSHSPNTKLTSNYFDGYYENFTLPTDDAVVGGYGFKEALVLLVDKLRTAYPSTKIVLCTMNIFNRTTNGNYPPTNSNSETLSQYNEAIREVADYMGCDVIEFDKDGITFNNASTGNYYIDYSAENGTFTHPNSNGHKMMGKRAVVDILKM